MIPKGCVIDLLKLSENDGLTKSIFIANQYFNIYL